MRYFLFLASFAGFFLSGCSTLESSVDKVTNIVTPYKIDIRQGNYVDQAMVAQLKKGMTHDQVRFLLGSPLIVDVFHENRWDYVYRFSPGQGEAEQRRISVFFTDNKLDYVEGDIQAGNVSELNEALHKVPVRVIEVPGSAPEK